MMDLATTETGVPLGKFDHNRNALSQFIDSDIPKGKKENENTV